MKTTQKKTNKLCLLLSVVAFSIVLLAKPMTAQAALSAPTNVRQTGATMTQIALAWDAVSTANGYDVEYSTDNGKTWTSTYVSTNGTTAIISNLTKATTYQVRVATKDSTGASGTPSQAIEVNTAPEMTQANLPKVTNVTSNSCTIAWAPVAGATGYYIDYGTSSEFANSNAYGQGFTTATSITMSLPANTGWYVFVTPYRTSANGTYKAEYSYGRTIVATAPSCPKSLQMVGVSSNAKTLTFGFVRTSSLDNTSGYQVEVYDYKNKKLKTLNTTTNVPSIQNSKFANTPIKYRVRSFVTLSGQTYYGNWSGYAYYVPNAMCGSKLKPTSSTSAKLTWKKIQGAKSYTVYYSTSGSNSSWKVTKKNVKGTSANVKYSKYSYRNCYYVQANSVTFKGKKGKVSSTNPKKIKYTYYVDSYTKR